MTTRLPIDETNIWTAFSPISRPPILIPIIFLQILYSFSWHTFIHFHKVKILLNRSHKFPKDKSGWNPKGGQKNLRLSSLLSIFLNCPEYPLKWANLDRLADVPECHFWRHKPFVLNMVFAAFACWAQGKSGQNMLCRKSQTPSDFDGLLSKTKPIIVSRNESNVNIFTSSTVFPPTTLESRFHLRRLSQQIGTALIVSAKLENSVRVGKSNLKRKKRRRQCTFVFPNCPQTPSPILTLWIMRYFGQTGEAL